MDVRECVGFSACALCARAVFVGFALPLSPALPCSAALLLSPGLLWFLVRGVVGAWPWECYTNPGSIHALAAVIYRTYCHYELTNTFLPSSPPFSPLPTRLIQSSLLPIHHKMIHEPTTTSTLVVDDEAEEKGSSKPQSPDVLGNELSESRKAHRASEDSLKAMAGSVRTILDAVGEDPEREGLEKTPMRVAKALRFFTSGYSVDLNQLVNGAVFAESHREMVVVRDIDVHSMCEHHMVPFIGKAHVAYIPRDNIIGLSKLARIVDMFARRLQVQERLGKQVAHAIQKVLDPLGVIVVIECVHMCMVMRGVQHTGASTTTSAALGKFVDDDRVRSEFFQHLNRTPAPYR